MTLLTLLQNAVAPIVNAVGGTKRRKYLIDYALQRKVNMYILTLSI
jgi:hypothetical protein